MIITFKVLRALLTSRRSLKAAGFHIVRVAIFSLTTGLVPLHTGFAKGQSKPSRAAEWWGYGNDDKEQRFSPLREINDTNVGRLGLAWSLDLPGENALEATSLEVGGVIYFSGSNNAVYAVDAESGQLLWRRDSDANRKAPRATRLIFPVNRGVAYWDGMVYIATRDCTMTALDAKTGKEVWNTSFLIPGIISTSSGAPRVFNGKVIIGNSGADFGARGYVTAFDAKTGTILWRFFVVPGNPAKGFENKALEMAAKTWAGEWWKYGGGGTPWNAITFDEELNQLYIGTGNGGPYNGNFRSPHGEDNLFLASVVALDANSGAYKWHYQYNPGEIWDWKATMDMVLADLNIAGRARKVLMQAPSNGFFYVIDRSTGKIISAEKIGKVTWADRIDLETGRPVERPGIRGESGSVIVYPSYVGAHNWQPMSYSPKTGLVYIPYIQLGMRYGPVPTAAKASDVTADPSRIMLRQGVPGEYFVDPKDPLDGRSSLLAWDPVAQKLRWRRDYYSLPNAGTMVTAGNLVFQGTDGGKLYAYSADKGARLWAFDAKTGILAPPISYAVNGRQYVSLLVGYGATGGYGPLGRKQGWRYGRQPRRLLAFSLNGNAKLSWTAPREVEAPKALDDPAVKTDAVRAGNGKAVYALACSLCHGPELDAGGGAAPDLKASALAMKLSIFQTVLRDGTRLDMGMPVFDDLSKDEVENLYQYIRLEARSSLTQGQ